VKFHYYISGILAVVAFSGSLAHANDDKSNERIYFNGKIFTAEPEHPYAEAIAIRGDKIVAVGNRVEVTAAAGKGAERIDLRGKTLLPGLIDSHIHAIDGGVSLISADVGDKVQNISELAEFAADAKKSGKGMRGDVLYISGMPLTFWSKTDELNARFSTGDYANIPVYLQGSDGHTGWANTTLRARVGVTKEFMRSLSEEKRKYFGVGPNMEPNGFAVDEGLEKIQAALRPRSCEIPPQPGNHFLARPPCGRSNPHRLSRSLAARRTHRARRSVPRNKTQG
jgi:predicted amidohydrolase YtcJ